eukprot:COSAG01_NODE_2249_length_8073_cov_2.946973_5_plen_108_part_00
MNKSTTVENLRAEVDKYGEIVDVHMPLDYYSAPPLTTAQLGKGRVVVFPGDRVHTHLRWGCPVLWPEHRARLQASNHAALRSSNSVTKLRRRAASNSSTASNWRGGT